MKKAQYEARRSEVAMNAFVNASLEGKGFMDCSRAEDAALAEFDAAYAAAASNAKSDFYYACADAFASPSAILTEMSAENDESPAYYKRAAAVVRAKFAAYMAA
jgi:hypothetical protein